MCGGRILTNNKPLICYKHIGEIELVEISMDEYIKFGDFDNIVIPCDGDDAAKINLGISDDVEQESDLISQCLGRDLWSAIA